MTERLLMTPGPTNLSKKVREIMAQPQIGHTDPDFVRNFSETLKLARQLFLNSRGEQYVFTGTGTVAMEAAVGATVEPGDKVLVLNTGYFGHRFSEILKCYGAEAEELVFPFGTHADPDAVRRKLLAGGYKAVYVTHVDTGSTVCNPVAEVVKEAKSAGVMAVVDGVCSIGGIAFDFDKVGADLAFTGSQKAIAAPPGALLIAVSSEFQRQLESRRDRIRTYYANLLRWKPVMDDPRNYFATHAVQILEALHQSLKDVIEEGLERRWERHSRNARIIQDGVLSVGNKLVAEDGYRAATVSGIWTAEGKAPEIQKRLREKHAIDIARGLGENGVRMLRVGHLGILTEENARSFVATFTESVKNVG